MQDPQLYDTTSIDRGHGIMTDGGVATQDGDPATIGGPESLDANTGFDAMIAQAAAKREADFSAQAAKRAATIRANGQLRKDEWKQLDENLVEKRLKDLKLVEMLRDAGLETDADLSVLIHEYETTDRFGDAEIDMGAETGSSEGGNAFGMNGIPLPIAHKGFHLNRRHLLASRRRGRALDTQGQTNAVRAVNAALENMLLNGWNGQMDGYQAYGLRTHPSRMTQDGADWTAGGTSPDTIRGNVLDAVEGLENAEFSEGNDGYMFPMGRGAYQALRRKDTGNNNERSVLARLEQEFDYIDFVKVPSMPDNEAIMFKPASDVIELVTASDLQTVEWSSGDGFTQHIKVMASMTPLIKADYEDTTGIYHLTGLDA